MITDHSPAPVLAQVKRVLSASELLVALELNWGIQLWRTVGIEGFDTVSLSYAEQSAAKHCLIVLAGNRKLWIHPVESSPTEVLKAHIYVLHELATRPVGWTLGLVDGDTAGLELGPYLESLRSHEFDVQCVLRDLNGKK